MNSQCQDVKELELLVRRLSELEARVSYLAEEVDLLGDAMSEEAEELDLGNPENLSEDINLHQSFHI